MIEGRDQPYVFRQQHAIAEYVAGHVADAGAGEVLRLDVDTDLAKVPLDAFPGAARGDAHALVVVAGGAARGEGVAEPVAIFDRNGIGDIGERRRALVRGHDEIGVVAVAAHHVCRRNGPAMHDVVGDVEQAADEGLVAGDAFLLHLLARSARGQPLRVEAALGAHRHDHRVLDVLRLHEAEHLGAVVFATIGPADAAARHVSHAQVHAFDARAVDEDLELRQRQRQVRNRVRVELERQPALDRARASVHRPSFDSSWSAASRESRKGRRAGCGPRRGSPPCRASAGCPAGYARRRARAPCRTARTAFRTAAPVVARSAPAPPRRVPCRPG